ncbi:hypothetical protein Ancab_015785 [Ancistrocladus abbreviatus]
MRRLVEHAVFQVEEEIGEKPVISFHGAGLSVAAEINYHDLALGCEDDEKVGSKFEMVVTAQLGCVFLQKYVGFKIYGSSRTTYGLLTLIGVKVSSDGHISFGYSALSDKLVLSSSFN